MDVSGLLKEVDSEANVEVTDDDMNDPDLLAELNEIAEPGITSFYLLLLFLFFSFPSSLFLSFSLSLFLSLLFLFLSFSLSLPHQTNRI